MSLELCSQAVLAYSRQPVKPGKDKAPLRSKYTSVSSIAKPSQNLSSLVGVVSIDVEAALTTPLRDVPFYLWLRGDDHGSRSDTRKRSC
jgi:hypothetical protein